MSAPPTEDPWKSHPGKNEEDFDLEFSIARSNALIPLLVMFILTVLVISVIIIREKPVAPPAGAVASSAYGPADFPAVFGKDEALVGLDSQAVGASKLEFPVPAPPFSEGVFPCMECHQGFPPNPERRALELMHTDIVLHHGEEQRWCLDCHDLEDRNQLRLASGALVPFTESYRLCGQCHGTQYRDWRTGIHGKRTGFWDGAKRYLLCVHCHNPHSPRFAALKPLPPPVRPQFLRPKHVAAVTADSGPSGNHSMKPDDHAKDAR